MKKIILLITVALFLGELQAKVLTVSNRAGNSAQYKTVPAAITAAAAGDTIYIHGSETSYGDVTIDKKLTLMGTGHNPKKELALVSTLGTVTVDAFNGGASGTSLIGLRIGSVSNATYGQKDVTIKRCRIDSYIYAFGSTGGISTNWIIENCIFPYVQISNDKTNVYNFLIRNNIITQGLYGTHTCVIDNNVFIGSSAAFSDVHYAIIQNNVFYGATPKGAANSTFNNNITFSPSDSALPYGTNGGSLNKVNVDPKFTKFTANVGFSYDHDYRLQASSPGKNAGTDKTDIGIYGGIGFSETGEPPVPVVRVFTILNGVVAPNGKLNIKISAEAKN
ncbi:hypothetical protein [Rufibacter aurantiacus]|uniref:hypothetical protein n=1 Tax=Rufibacter aurantiacus TaxID=2817374 RepID=UPI001B30EBDB|nr:hypothetical protein [Rufibacter aurantiacus]